MTGANHARYGAAAFEGLTGQLPQPFPRPIGPRAMELLREVVDSGLTLDMAGRFERAFAERLGVKHCIATPGCTPALAMLAAAMNFDPGDEVIVSPITDYGTVMGLIHENLIPVFADTEPGTINLSAATIEPCITDRTRAILAVHKTGIICDMDPINDLAAKHDLRVFEDACQAVFGRYKGRLAGTLGDAAGFSFDAEKTMGSDVGGCLVTNDDAIAERARFVGQSRGGRMREGFGREHVVAGYAHRMPACTAAICLAQLDIIEQNVARRDRAARRIAQGLARIPGITPLPIPEQLDVYSCWMVGLSMDREQFGCTADQFADQLVAAGIPGAGTGRYYLMPAALPFLQRAAKDRVYPYSKPPASRDYEYSADTCPRARDFLESFVRWSTFCERYTDDHCDLAVALVKDVAERNRRTK